MKIDDLKAKVDQIRDLLTILNSLLDTLKEDKQVLEYAGLEPLLLDDLEGQIAEVRESISYMIFQIKG